MASLQLKDGHEAGFARMVADLKRRNALTTPSHGEQAAAMARDTLGILVGAVLHRLSLDQNLVTIEQRLERMAVGFPSLKPGMRDHARGKLQHEPDAIEPALGRAERRIEGDLGRQGTAISLEASASRALECQA